jgi:hypothetical protein
VSIKGFTGEISLNTMSGDVRAASTTGALTLQTASGDVHLTLRRPAADGAEPAADLAFRTVSGDAHVSAPFRKTDRRRWQSGPGDRGPHIEVQTVNGDLTATIAATEGAFVPAPRPVVVVDEATPPQEGAERLAVLEAVERGEIDVEEALRRLDAEEAVANP